MKKLLVVFTVLALSATAFAYPGPDSIGLYPDPDTDSFTEADLCMSTSGAFEEITVYLCITNPSAGGVSGWEGMVEFVGPLTAASWELSAGLDVDTANDTDTVEAFQVGIGVTPLAVMANTNGSVPLATFSAYVMNTTDEIDFLIYGVPGTVSFDPPTPGYGNPTDAGDLIAVHSNVGDWTARVFAVNDEDCIITKDESSSFGEVKTLFR